MRLRDSDLALRSTGSTVSLLHFELQLLDVQIPRREREDNVFGRGTRRAVLQLQRQLQLEPTGVVDEETAKRLNREVERRTPGERVLVRLAEVLREEMGRLDDLENEDDPVPAGKIGQRLDAFAAAADDLIGPEADVPEALRARVRKALEKLRARVDDATGEDENGGRIRTVSGRVTDHDRVGVAGLLVVAVERRIGRDETLGRGATGDGGRYEIRYRYRYGGGRGGREGGPDLRVEVHGSGDGDDRLARSDIRYDAGLHETLDVVVPEGRLAREPEYRRLTRELAVHVDDREDGDAARLADLEESEERRDLTFLAEKTGWDARAVAMAALADRFGETTGVDAELLYALFRAGVPAEGRVLAGVGRDLAKGVWEAAAEQGVVSPEVADRIPESLEQFDAYRVDRLLEDTPAAGGSSLRELLELSLDGDDEEARAVAELFAGGRDDPEAFWSGVRRELGEDAAARLQLDGRLAFLTVNNAPLVARIHESAQPGAPDDLVRAGLYEEEAWGELLADDVEIPDGIPGDDEDERRANYATFMAGQLRLAYPTAVVAEMVDAGEMPLSVPEAREGVYEFLSTHQGDFELGVQPVGLYLRDRDVELSDDVLRQVERLQRVYQITPSDPTMTALLRQGIDSAYAVTRYGEPEFVRLHGEGLGGEREARRVYRKAHQVHNVTLNVATDYLLRRRAGPVFAIDGPGGEGAAGDVAAGDGEGEDGDPGDAGTDGGGTDGDGAGPAADVLAMPTLEGLFGEMDFCACDHCRSVLSPAAYLVDLLASLDLERRNAEGEELPSDAEGENPLEVLLERRPDLQHLALTCENTNTALPYVDVVNEILEHFAVSGVDDGDHSLEGFRGHDVEEGTRSEDLLANPQFVDDAAYEALRDAPYPLALPFHRSLIALRRYFGYFDIELHEAMRALRADDDLNRAGPEDYGWRDVLMEQVGITRQEHVLLTDASVPLHELYGEEPGAVTTEELRDRLASAPALARALDIDYEELIRLLRTRFVNPHVALIPRLEGLFVDLSVLRDLHEGDLAEEAFRDLLPDDLDEADYGGDVVAWVEEHFDEIMGLVVLSDPSGDADVCSFEELELRYASPDFETNRVRPVELRKILRFVRLWRALGWTVEQTDRVLHALYPADQRPAAGDDEATVRAKLDAGLRTFVPRLAHALETMELLDLEPRRHLARALALWAPIDTTGRRSLYREMFLNPAVPGQPDAFRDDGAGDVLDGSEMLGDHREALRAAFDLTDRELSLVLDVLGYDDETPLTLGNVSAVYRRGFLARSLGTSVRELLGLVELSRLEPFSSPDPVLPDAVRFVELALRLRASPFTVGRVLYLLAHDDPTGEASPSRDDVLDLARTLRRGLERIDQEHRVPDDPTVEGVRAEMARAYGSEAAETFFGLLRGTSLHTVAYDHGASELQEDIRDLSDRLSYDDFGKRLSYRGLLTEAEKTALEAAPSATDAFRAALDGLREAGEEEARDFFARHPELRDLHDDFRTSPAPEGVKLTSLAEAFLPEIKDRLKRQFLRQTVGAGIDVPPGTVRTLLEEPAVLHADGRAGEPVTADLLGLEADGLSAAYHFAADASGAPDLKPEDPVEAIRYGDDAADLPENPDPGEDVVSAVWRGYLEAPDSGAFNFYVRVDAGAAVSLAMDGSPVPMAPEDGVWENQEAVELEAGRFYALELTVERVAETTVFEWAGRSLARGPVPARQLYPEGRIDRWAATYLRLLKVLTVTEELELSSEEIVHFATHPDYAVDGGSWLDALPAEADATDAATGRALLVAFSDLLRYRELREELDGGGRLLNVLRDPEAESEAADGLLDRATGWEADDREVLMARFGLATADLSRLGAFDRLHRAFAVVDALGIGAETLSGAVTNDPAPDAVRRLEEALRARYSDEAWRKIVRPINDELRDLRRDALVAYALHRLSRDPATAHVDTPEKLFEYFLIDVEMDACMLTSRVKQALSTTQLFIQRCLLNLEPRVEPSAIDAGQWAWMKRYRVWEANRKVFLFPENWLEPELRDNKSPFFEDLESELLEADITEDAAATALLGYLEKLDEVAALEICGLHVDEGDEAGETVHVVARTAGTRRRYFHRALEHGSWSPWEPLDVDIEDRPVIPVVWRGRLFVFWLGVLQKGLESQEPPTTAPDDSKLVDLEAGQLSGSVETQVEATLYWSERYNGTWQPARSSDVNRALVVGSFPPAGADAFDRRELHLDVDESEDALRLHVRYGTGYTLRAPGGFELYNSHSLPLTIDGAAGLGLGGEARLFSANDAPFTITYDAAFGLYGDGIPEPVTRTVLGSARGYEAVQPRHPVAHPFTAPFFFQDRRHVFLVRSERRSVRVSTYPGFGLLDPPRVVDRVALPPVLERPVLDDLLVREDVAGGPDVVQPGVVDPAPVRRFLRDEGLRVRTVLGTGGGVRFGDRIVGPDASRSTDPVTRER